MPRSSRLEAARAIMDGLRLRSTWAIVASMSRPYGTPDGQTASQARHWMHRSQWSVTVGPIEIRPSLTAFINAMRPRGDSVSSPVSTYVGHAWRQKPQCTHL